MVTKDVAAPPDCQHRHPLTPISSSSVSSTCDETVSSVGVCNLARRYLEDAIGEATQSCQVTSSICCACQSQTALTESGLNPVVASLIYRATRKSETPGRQTILLEQIREFCEPHLIGQGTSQALSEAPSKKGDAANPSLSKATLGQNPSAQADRKGSFVKKLWRSLKRQSISWKCGPRVGLLGRNSPYGLGHQNRDLAKQLNIRDWLAPECGALPPKIGPANCTMVPVQASKNSLREFINRIDVMLFAESPAFPTATAVAKQNEVPVVCIPNWEWIRPGLPWVDDVNLMICPCYRTYEMLASWKNRFAFRWELILVPWPIAYDRFPFRQRTRCERFLFIGGNGGCRASFEDGRLPVRRKGLVLMLEAAKRLPTCQFILHTSERIRQYPKNVELRGYSGDNVDLYTDGDVCVQPSYWEGIGLPLLECQAAGLPLITTNIAPMNEYQPLATIPVRSHSIGNIGRRQRIEVPEIEADDLADCLRTVMGKDISAESRLAHEFVRTQHAWDIHRSTIQSAINRLV